MWFKLSLLALCSVSQLSAHGQNTAHIKRLNILGEVEYTNLGVKYQFCKYDTSWHGKRVVVIGNSDMTVHRAQLLSYRALSVLVFIQNENRRDLTQLKSIPNVTILPYETIRAIIGNGTRATAIALEKETIACDQIFMCVE